MLGQHADAMWVIGINKHGESVPEAAVRDMNVAVDCMCSRDSSEGVLPQASPGRVKVSRSGWGMARGFPSLRCRGW
jgi:hypothetical protein